MRDGWCDCARVMIVEGDKTTKINNDRIEQKSSNCNPENVN